MLLLSVSCNGQQPNEKLSDKKNGIVGGGCDGCELMYIGMPEKYNLPIQVQAGMKRPETDCNRNRFSDRWKNTCARRYYLLLADGQ